jgi:hypothetical protein
MALLLVVGSAAITFLVWSFIGFRQALKEQPRLVGFFGQAQQ